MERMSELWRRLLFLLRRRQFERDLEEEMRFHAEMLAERLRAAGVPAGEAARAARRRFGNPTLLREDSRDAWRWAALETLAQDVRHALRLLARSPAATAAAVLTLALGIGANCVMFSVFDAALLKPFPFREPERLVFAWTAWQQRRVMNSLPDFLDWRARNDVFETMGAWLSASYDLGGAAYPERLQGRRATASLFPTLGVQPQLGRLFAAREEYGGRARVALISDKLWRTRFHSDRGVAGSRILLGLNGGAPEPYTIIGVLPPGVHSAFPKDSDVWTPLTVDGEEARERRMRGLNVIGRLKAGVSIPHAEAALSGIARALAAEHPGTNRDCNGVALEDFHRYLTGYGREVLPSLMGAVAFVLLLACANVANLMLARASDREHEMAIRSALGAGRGRLFRQLMTESLVVSLAGGAAGTLLAAWAVRGARALVPAGILRAPEIAIDLRVLVFVLGVSILTGLAFGIAPSLRASARRPQPRDRAALRHVLVVAEIALGMVLLTGAALMLNSFVRLLRVDPGFDRHDVLVVNTGLPWRQYRESEQARYAAIEDVLARVRALPGVRYAAVSDFRPLGNTMNTFVRKQSAPDTAFAVNAESVTPDYFLAMGIRQVRGRVFSPRDASGAPDVALINESAARRYWPGEDPVGKRISIGRGKELRFREIVGIVADVRRKGLDKPAEPAVYMPQAQGPSYVLDLVVRAQPGVPPPQAAATLLAARRAMRLDPVAALRHE